MTKSKALCVFSFLALFTAATIHSQTLRWSDDRTISGAGSINGDARLKASIAFANPGSQVYLKISGWEQLYSQRSYLYIYIWDADNYWSTTPFAIYNMYLSGSESTLYFPVNVPQSHRFSVEVRARCNQDTSYWAPGKTYTYNRLLEVYW